MTQAVTIQSIAGQKSIHAIIELDMSSYCIALREYVSVIRLIERQRQELDLVSIKSILVQSNESTLRDFERSRSEIYDRVQREKNALSHLVRGLAGDMHAVELIELLKSQLAVGNEAERILAAQLMQEKPLVFECLESGFVELLKNSMDAIIELGTETGLRKDMHLMMNVQLDLLSDSRVAISIKDNGGGFSEKYLSQFSSFIEEKKYLYEMHATHKNTSSFYFGGRGRGIGLVCGKLLDGVAVTPNRNVRLYHPASCQKNSISIINVERGAEIKLISSTTPAKKYDGLFSRSDKGLFECLSSKALPFHRGECLLDQEGSSLPSSSAGSSLHQHSLFSPRLPAPLNPAALKEVDLALYSMHM